MKRHSIRFLEFVAKAKEHVNEISAVDLNDKLSQNDDFTLIDVREEHEWQAGHLPRAIHLSKGVLERDIEKVIDDTERELVLYCSGGFRSVLACLSLLQTGFHNLKSLNGGSTAWLRDGYPMQKD